MTGTPLPEEAAAQVNEWLGNGWQAHALAGDASARAYYRIAASDGRTYMLAWYPPEVRAQLHRFVAAYDVVHDHAHVPAVVRHSESAVLQQDVGDTTVFAVLHRDREQGVKLYRQAVDLLVNFQKSEDARLNPAFSAESFLAELEMTREYYAGRLMGLSETEGGLSEAIRILCEKVAQHPYVICHRDFHGQNIHLIGRRTYLLDYQDMRMGPDTYDLASLLRDRGVADVLGDATEMELVDYYRQRIGAGQDLRRRYFETLLQRSVKILGTFARQAVVRGRLHYLEFIPAALRSVERCLQELPEFGSLAAVLPMKFSLDEARRRLAAQKEM